MNEALAKKLVQDNHEVIFLVGGFEGGEKVEIIDGYKIIRLGNRWTVYWRAFRYYKKELTGWADVVIDEMNAVPFFCKLFVKEKNILFVHQLAREIWFYEMFTPLNLVGYLIELFFLRLLKDRKVITVSNSTKNDLLNYGFKEDRISIISEGIEILPVDNPGNIVKYEKPTILSLGSLRAMKRVKDIIKAYELSKKEINDLQLIIAGDANGTRCGKKILKKVLNSKYKDEIKYLGYISRDKKIEVIGKSHIICAASVKEGWGLVITEANSQAVPAVVYNVDGLRDSVNNMKTGIICEKNTPEKMSEKIIWLFRNYDQYAKMRVAAWEQSKRINFERSYDDFIKIIKNLS